MMRNISTLLFIKKRYKHFSFQFSWKNYEIKYGFCYMYTVFRFIKNPCIFNYTWWSGISIKLMLQNIYFLYFNKLPHISPYFGGLFINDQLSIKNQNIQCDDNQMLTDALGNLDQWFVTKVTHLSVLLP